MKTQDYIRTKHMLSNHDVAVWYRCKTYVMYEKYTLEYAVMRHVFINKCYSRIFIVRTFLFWGNEHLYWNKRSSKSAKNLINSQGVYSKKYSTTSITEPFDRLSAVLTFCPGKLKGDQCC